MATSGKIVDDGNRHFYARVRECLKCGEKFLSLDGKFTCRDCARQNVDVSAREASPGRTPPDITS